MPPQTSSNRRSFSFESASVWVIVATVILAAVIIVPSASIPFVPTKAFVIAIGTCLALALYILARLSRGNAILPPALLLGALWLPPIAYALSTAFSGAPVSLALFGSAFDTDTFGFILAAAMLGTLTALTVRRSRDFRGFFSILAWALGVVVVLQILALIVGQFSPNTISPSFSILGSYNDLAALAGLGLILGLLTLRLIDVAPMGRWVLLVLGLGELFILVIANDSLPWILVALAALALFVEAVLSSSTKAMAGENAEDFEELAASEGAGGHAGGRHMFLVPLVVLAAALFFVVGSSFGNAIQTAFHVSVLDVRPSWQSTLATGSAVYHSSPLFGSGPDTFGSAWLKSRDAALNTTVFWNVDFDSGVGYLPTSFVTTGLIGLLAWLLFLGTFLFVGLRALLFRTPEDPAARYAALASFVAAVYLAALALFSVPGPVLLALLFVFAGVFASTLRYAKGKGQWGIIFGKSPKVGFAIVFVLTLLLLAAIGAAYAIVERYAAQVEITAAQADYSAGNIAGANTDATRALSFAELPSAYIALATVADTQLTQIAANTALSPTDARQQFQAALSAGISAAQTATKLSPNDYQTWVALGNLYATVVPYNVTGAYDSAKAAYTTAEQLNPTSPALPYLMAQLDIADKNNAAAEADLKQTISLKQDNAQAIFLLSQLEVADGNVKDALVAAEAAAYFTPTDPSALFQVGLLRAANNDLPGAVTALTAAVQQNPQFANARYFLAVADAALKDYSDAAIQLQAIGAMSDANQQAVAKDLASLQAGKDPFPASLLAAPAAPVTQ